MEPLCAQPFDGSAVTVLCRRSSETVDDIFVRNSRQLTLNPTAGLNLQFTIYINVTADYKWREGTKDN
jgi:hypothetical protein